MAVVLCCAGCSPDEDAASTTTPAPTSTSTVTSTSVDPTSSTTTTTALTTTAAAAAPTTTVPGEPIPGPPPGSSWGVVGVAHDDVLNVRGGPGPGRSIVATLAPLTDRITATGNGYQFDHSLWWEIESGVTNGWVNAAFLAAPGAVDDASAEIIARLGGIPEAPSLEAFGGLVAGVRSGDEPVARVVVVVAPTVGDLGEITLDVVGIGDDAIYGERLHLFAFPPQNGVGFVLKNVERTVLCLRAATDEGLCV
jgi:hypothetical protein